MHLKRQKVPKNWPIYRKGTKYVVRGNCSLEKGVPLLIILRDMLNIVQNRKEAKKAIHEKYILLNNKITKDEKNSALLFDTLTIIPSKKYYRIGFSNNGKFEVKEIKENETNYKIAKVVDKKILRGKKIQLNLSDGRNFLSDIKCKINDSVLINFKDKKIDKCLPFKEKAKVIIFSGKHSGKIGIINKIKTERKMAELSIKKDSKEKEVIDVLIKQLMIIE